MSIAALINPNTNDVYCKELISEDIISTNGTINTLIVDTINGIIPGSGTISAGNENDLLMTKAGVADWSNNIVLQNGLLSIDAGSTFQNDAVTTSFTGTNVEFDQSNTFITGNMFLNNNSELTITGPAKLIVENNGEISVRDGSSISCTDASINMNGGTGIILNNGANLLVGSASYVASHRYNFSRNDALVTSSLSMYKTQTINFDLSIKRLLGFDDIYIATVPITFTRIGRSITMSTQHYIFTFFSSIIGIQGFLKLAPAEPFSTVFHANPRWGVSTPIYSGGLQVLGIIFVDGDNSMYISGGASVDTAFTFNNNTQYGYGCISNALGIGSCGGLTLTYTRATDD